SFLGTDVGMEVDLKRESANSSKVMYELSDVQKCTLVYEMLLKVGQLSHLNNDLERKRQPKGFVRFSSEVRASEFEYRRIILDSLDEMKTKKRHPESKGFPIEGNIGGWKIQMVCFWEFFRTSPNFAAL